MNFQQIRSFLVLAKELHFWKTAEKVYTSQSSLSRQIQMLEEELGIQLFERNKRNVKLTQAGVFLHQRWETLLDEFDRINREAKKIHEGSSGALSFAYPGSISFNYLPKLLKTLGEEMPNLKVELVEPTDENHGILLVNHQIDLAFSRDAIENPGIDSVELFSEPVCLVVPDGHWVTEESFNDLRDVKEENFLISGLHHTTYFASLLRQLFSVHGFEPKIQIESDFGGMILSLVSNGLGISILPFSFSSSSNANVRFIELPERVGLFINWRKNEQNKALKKVVEYSIRVGNEQIDEGTT